MPRAQLLELHARNLGVIGEANLEFGQGFNVLTGETGAGKTLLLDALGLCLGDDASGTRHALAPATRAVALFRDTNGDEIVLGREMSDAGRLRSLVNGAPASVESLRHYAQGLIVVHGQHDSLLLRGRSEILRLIDDSAHLDTRELSDVRARLREARSLRDAMGGDDFTRQRELEFAAFQIAELESARITSPSELDDALGELARLSALRDGQAAIADVVEVIDGDADEAVLSRFAAAVELIPEAAAYDDIRRDLAAALVQAREAVRELAELADPEAVDARLLGELEDRVGVLQGIARKYGGSLASALATLGDLRSRLARAGHDDERRRHIDEEIGELEQREAECASALRGQRERAAAELSDRVARQLRRVALEHASLRFSVQGDDGSQAQILFSANPGQLAGPLSELASGGELSRVLLALSLESVHQEVVAVFDEIDAGLGGQVAQQIGDCLAEVGQHQQVLAITHLASVAARADHHFVIEKSVTKKGTSTQVRRVEGDERVREIARMLAGDTVSVESYALASQLLEKSPESRSASASSR